MDMQTQPVLFDHQAECLANATKELSIADRCKIIMACGTGKTRIGPEIALSLAAQSIVVYLPSLALVRQTLPEWLKAPFSNGLDFICVCSDETVATFSDEARLTIDDLVDDLGIERNRVTTNSTNINRYLTEQTSGLRVVFCTYQSCDTLRDGLPEGFAFELGIFDEAHKTAGRNVAFSAPLNDRHTPINKRVFMTATPKHFDIRKRDKEGDVKAAYSMDDEASYGRTAYNLPIRKAIELGVIAGYQVLVSVIDDKTIAKTLRDKTIGDTQQEGIAHAIAIKNAMDEYGLKKAVTFHDTVENASFFAEHVLIKQELGLPTFHVSGQLNSKQRSAIMDSFASAERGIVTNARCLTEGVDVPAIDLVAFLHPKKSQIDIIQAIGRALRRPIGGTKTTGYILLPLYVSDADNGGLESALQEYGYDTIFQVIQALREQDEVVDAALTQFKIDRVQNKGDGEFNLDFITTSWAGNQVNVLRNVISTRIVDTLVESWYTNYALLKEIYEQTANINIEKSLTYRGVNIGFWCGTQRANYKAGILTKNRIELLNKLGFSWNMIDSTWNSRFEILYNIWLSTGSSNISTDLIVDNFNIGEWVQTQRKNFKKKILSLDKLEKLESIGFIYDYKENVWLSYFNALNEVYKLSGDANVSVSFMVGDLPVGRWLGDQRKYYAKGKVTAERAKLLESISVKWSVLESTWEESFNILKQIYLTTGDANIAGTTVIDGNKVGDWLRIQRSNFRFGKLQLERKKILESIGVSFKSVKNDWEANFDIYKRFLVSCDSQDELTEDFDTRRKGILKWAWRQRQNYKIGKLSQDKITKLESVGFKWAA